VKRSKNKNVCTNCPSYPRDIWEFVARSKERVMNTKTGANLHDILDHQKLTPTQQEKMDSEMEFPKTVFPQIDPERLKPRAVSVPPDVQAAAKKLDKRYSFLSSGGRDKKHGILGLLKGHFDIAAIEDQREQYMTQRPKWLEPKKKEHVFVNKEKKFNPSRGISKAEQEEMLTQAIFEDARTKVDRARDLSHAFNQNLIAGKLERAQVDLALNRVFFEPEENKLAHLDSHFCQKNIDPNLDIRVIESATPTKFFEMVHRRLNPKHFHPETYLDIVDKLTPEPVEAVVDIADFHRSPYLTYVPPALDPPSEKESEEAKIKREEERKRRMKQGMDLTARGRFFTRAGDDDRWGRRTLIDVFTMSERYRDLNLPTNVPRGLGKLKTTMLGRNSSLESPWMGGGPGPANMPSPQSMSPTSPKSLSPSIRRTESSTFITQKSGPI